MDVPSEDPAGLAARLAVVWLDRFRQRGHQPKPITHEERTRSIQLVDLLTGVSLNTSAARSAVAYPTSLSIAELQSTAWALNANMDVYEDPGLLDKALDEIPLQKLSDEATLSSTDKLAFEDALVDCLARWFKSSYMRWVDSLPCLRCDGPATCTSTVSPTLSELEGGARRVELHRCRRDDCGAVRRFPRYNSPAMLMRTREGRCGEWANLFTLFLRAIGLRTRYIWNKEDHVWNEYFSPGLSRWVHVDSCEAARDKPLLYERGWGKEMSYIFGFSTEGVKDVSRAYTMDWPAMSRRRRWVPEPKIDEVLRAITAVRRAHVAPEALKRLQAEDAMEDEQLLRGPFIVPETEPSRQSGSREWTEARGESGQSSDS